MRYLIVLVSLFLLLCFKINAQTIITGTVSDSLNKPIPNASVYLSQTTVGTISNSDGIYSLTVPVNGIYEMITSFIGYKPNSQFISASGKNQKIDIKLSMNMFLLKEVTIKSKDKHRLENITLFRKLFIGETPNAEDCKILNPEDLHLYRDDEKNLLTGFSVNPLRIENRALGYTVVYDLSEFSFYSETGLLKFKGYHYFLPLTGSARESKRWIRNRLSAYYGSRMDLFRAMFSDSLVHENFELFKCKTDSLTKELTITGQIVPGNISLTKTIDFITVYCKEPVLIKYTNTHSELATGLTGFVPQRKVSTILFSDFINVYQNGYFDNPYSITWGGELANERVAELLPYDFFPNDGGVTDFEIEPVASPVENFLLAKQKGVCMDQIFVQTDRNMYSPGDTIRFQAYIRDRFTGLFESKSASLYSLLYNEDKIVVDSSRFKTDKSTSSGWMTIPLKAQSGKYHFAAFTGMMQNNDPVDAFQLDLMVKEKGYASGVIEIEFDRNGYAAGDVAVSKIKIRNSKDEPEVKQKIQCSLVAGKNSLETFSAETDNNGETAVRFSIPDSIRSQPQIRVVIKQGSNKTPVTKDFNIPFENQYLDLKFLPEGGTFITGLEQRIGFNATDYKGEPVFIQGLLKNKKGIILDTVKSGIYGPGLFVCTPDSGMYVELFNTYLKEKIWPLPTPDKSGVCMSVKALDSRSFSVEIQSTGYSGESFTLAGIMNTTQIFSNEMQLTKKQRIVVQTDQMLSGVVQITLFNKDLKPVAERLFYANPDKHLKFRIRAGKEIYKPGEETELSVTVTDGSGNPVEGIFSISVADSITGHNSEIFTPGIEYSYNYHPAFPGKLPSKVLIEGIENLPDNDREVLMMVYGWSRYNWDFSRPKNKSDEIVNYDLLKMKILYTSKIHRADRRLDLFSLEGPSVKHLLTNNEGEISLPLDSLPAITRSVTMMPDVKNKKRVRGAMLSIPFNEKYFKSNKLLTPLPAIQTDADYRLPVNSKIPFADSIIQIPEVIIRGQSENKRVYHDKYEETYQYTDVRSLDYNLLWTSFSVSDAVRRLICPYAMNDKYIILRSPRSFFGPPQPALIVLDGMPLYYGGWSAVNYMASNDLTSLTILMGNQAYAIYGEAAQGGVIFINTRSTDPNLMKIRTNWKLQNSKDNMLLPISIYRPYKEFYVPTKFEVDNDPAIQRLSTIFWEPEVYFNGKEPVKIKYYNLKRQGPAIITVNGASVTNLVGTGKASYSVFEKR